MFYEQQLQAQIPKVKKYTDDSTVFLRFFGSAWIKAAHKHVDKIDS